MLLAHCTNSLAHHCPASLLNIIFIFFFYTSSVIQDGDSALTLAAWCGLTDVVVELVRAGANLDLQNEVRTAVKPLLKYWV